MPIGAALTVARAFAHFLNLANIAEQHHRVRRRRDHARDPHGAPQRGSCAETFARLRSEGVPADALAAVDCLDARRARLHGASHRDRPPHASAETQPDCADSRLTRSPGPDVGRAGGIAGRASSRDRGGVADRRGTPRGRVAARRSPCGPCGVRTKSVGGVAAVSARRRSRARRCGRHIAATSGHTHSFRDVDWRRPRRQPQHHAGGDAAGDLAGALAGRRLVSQGGGRASARAVVVGIACQRRASRKSGHRPRTVPHAAGRGARSPGCHTRSCGGGVVGFGAEADRHCAVSFRRRTGRTARVVRSFARGDGQWGPRRRPADRYPAPRRDVWGHACAARYPSGSRPPYRGGGLGGQGGGNGAVCPAERTGSPASARSSNSRETR